MSNKGISPKRKAHGSELTKNDQNDPMTLFIDYLEDASSKLVTMAGKLQELNRQYNKFYDKQLRDEISAVKKEINTARKEVKDKIYRNIDELRLIKKHFPDLLEVLSGDEIIGKIIKDREWLLDFKDRKAAEANSVLHGIHAKRRQLRDVKKFLAGWVGKIDRRSLTATWNVLKEEIKEDMEKEEALFAIDEKDKKLRKEAWLVLLSEEMIVQPLQKLFKKLEKLNAEAVQKRFDFEKAKGRGTTAEYQAKKEYDEAEHRKNRMESIITQILLCNSAFLQKIKKMKPSIRDKPFTQRLCRFAQKIDWKAIDEKKWVAEMRERIAN